MGKGNGVRDVSEVPGLKRKKKTFIADAEELIEITDDVKKLQDRAGELRLSLYDTMNEELNEDEKSVRVGEYRLTAYQGKPRMVLDKTKLLKHITAEKLAKCYVESDPPRPTVQVTRIGPETEEEKLMRKVKRVGKALRDGLDD